MKLFLTRIFGMWQEAQTIIIIFFLLSTYLQNWSHEFENLLKLKRPFSCIWQSNDIIELQENADTIYRISFKFVTC